LIEPSTVTSRFQVVAIVPAGGSGARFGAVLPKQYVTIAGATVIEHSLKALLSAKGVEHVYLVVQSDDQHAESILSQFALAQSVSLLRCAGETRAQTVVNALHEIRKLVNRDAWVLVHDAARPCVTPMHVEMLMHVAGGESVGGLLALPLTDSLKRASPTGESVESLPREGIWRAQTPQMFRYETLLHALQSSPDVTDESQAIEALGLNPVLVHGDPRNIKITIAEDAEMAELFLRDAT
jgi:2-C-methyl-D-erythritol 4-phosphate cytidylyltransferase